MLVVLEVLGSQSETPLHMVYTLILFILATGYLYTSESKDISDDNLMDIVLMKRALTQSNLADILQYFA